MMSYNIDTTCWPHTLHRVIQGRVHSSQHGLSVKVYKIDYFVKSSLLLQQPLVTQGQLISPLAKLSSGLSSNEWGNYKRTRQGALAALLFYLYKLYMVHATTICLPHVHPLCFYLMSYYSSTCVFLKATMLPTCVLTSYL